MEGTDMGVQFFIENWYGLGAFAAGVIHLWAVIKYDTSNGDELTLGLLTPLVMALWPIFATFLLLMSVYSAYQRKVKRNPEYGYVASTQKSDSP